MDESISFGNWLKRRRGSLDLTQAELGQRVGCSAITIRKIEADELRPSRQLAERLAVQLKLPTAEYPQFVLFARDGVSDKLFRPPESVCSQ